MFEKEVVSHNTDAQNRVQAKSNSCYLKQNNRAPFNTKQKILEVFDFFEVYLEIHAHSALLQSLHPGIAVVWCGTHLERTSITPYQGAAYAALLGSVSSKMVVESTEIWLICYTDVWNQVKTCE